MSNIAPQSVIEFEAERLRSAYAVASLRNGITQVQVAKAAGWKSSSSFSDALHGKRLLTPEQIVRIALVLNVEPASISRRITSAELGELVDKVSRRLTVSHVAELYRSSWTHQLPTPAFISVHTNDTTAFALTLDPKTAPLALANRVLIVEPAGMIEAGDTVICTKKRGRFYIATVDELLATAEVMLTIDGDPSIKLKKSSCMLVASLQRVSAIERDSSVRLLTAV